MGNSDSRRITRSTESDGAVLAEGRASRGRRRWIIVGLAIGLEQKKCIVVVERLASDVGVHSARARLILKGDIDGSHCVGSEDVDL